MGISFLMLWIRNYNNIKSCAFFATKFLVLPHNCLVFTFVFVCLGIRKSWCLSCFSAKKAQRFGPVLCFPPFSTVWHWAHFWVKIFFLPASASPILFCNETLKIKENITFAKLEKRSHHFEGNTNDSKQKIEFKACLLWSLNAQKH